MSAVDWLTYGLTAAITFGIGWWLSLERTRISYRARARQISQSFPSELPDDLRLGPRLTEPHRVIDAMIDLGKTHDQHDPAWTLHSYLDQCVRYVETAATRDGSGPTYRLG